MALLLKITALCLLAAFLALFLRSASPCFALLLLLAACGACLLLLGELLQPLLDFWNSALKAGGLDRELFLPLLKVLLLSLTVKLGSSFCRDSGSSLAAGTLELAGMFCSLQIMLPLLRQVLQLLLLWQ